jgi:hypothetical protein
MKIKNKKAQMKIQQMAFMIMAVFLFFILVGMFWLVMTSQGLKREATLNERNNAIELANSLAGSAEFSCGDYCIDMDRLMVLSKKPEYKDFWRDASVEARMISNESERMCTDGNYPNCNYLKVIENKKEGGSISVSSFVSLCHRVKEGEYVEYKCELGKFIIGYEVK